MHDVQRGHLAREPQEPGAEAGDAREPPDAEALQVPARGEALEAYRGDVARSHVRHAPPLRHLQREAPPRGRHGPGADEDVAGPEEAQDGL